MNIRRWQAGVVVFGLFLAGSVARAKPAGEAAFGDILNELGLKKKPPASPQETPRRAVVGRATAAGSEKADGAESSAKPKSAGRTEAPAGPSFTRVIHPLFLATCKACHTPGGAAAATHLLFTGDAAADHRTVSRFVNVHDREASTLLEKASGAILHGGGAPWPASSAPYKRVLAWIRAGARLDHATREEPAAAPEAQAPDDAREGSTPGVSGLSRDAAGAGAVERATRSRDSGGHPAAPASGRAPSCLGGARSANRPGVRHRGPPGHHEPLRRLSPRRWAGRDDAVPAFR